MAALQTQPNGAAAPVTDAHGALAILLPRDGLFCKDGRGWFSSSSGQGNALRWPFPSTVRGALRTAWGLRAIQKRARPQELPFAWVAETRELRLQVVLPLRRRFGQDWTQSTRMWPAPRDAVARPTDGHDGSLRFARLLPQRPTGPAVKSLVFDEKAHPALTHLWYPRLQRSAPTAAEGAARKPLDAPPWWSDGDFIPWLCSTATPSLDEAACATQEHHARRDVRLAIEPATQTAKDSALYSLETVEMLARWPRRADPGREIRGCEDTSATAFTEWAIALRCSLPRADATFPPGPLILGGKRRLALHEPGEAVPADLFAMPQELKNAFAAAKAPRGLRIVIVTPAHFEQGWLPDGITAQEGEYRGHLLGIQAELILRAAIVDRPLHASGWDMAATAAPTASPGAATREEPPLGQAKATRRLVPAGSVYFFTKRDDSPFTATEAEALWLQPLTRGDAQHRDDGFGVVVPGVWDPLDTQDLR